MKLLRWFPCLLVAACMTVPSPAERRGVAAALARAQGWVAVSLPAGQFDLQAFVPEQPARRASLTIYIEGDGLAWITGAHASSDPTPSDPLALRLALAQPEGNAAYLGRPCQYVDAAAANCSSRYWTEARFAPQVIAATDQAIEALKQRFGAHRLMLVGYSGGAAVAALVAARRNDVERLVTVAGNLDHRAWTSYQRIRPLDGSLNPADQIGALRHIPQWHFAGGKDRNITPALIEAFAARFAPGQQPVVRVEREFDHRCCWADHWPSLWRQINAAR